MDLQSDALERQPSAAGDFLFFRVPQVEHNLFFHLVRYSQMSDGNHDSVALAGVLRASFLAELLLTFCFFDGLFFWRWGGGRSLQLKMASTNTSHLVTSWRRDPAPNGTPAQARGEVPMPSDDSQPLGSSSATWSSFALAEDGTRLPTWRQPSLSTICPPLPDFAICPDGATSSPPPSLANLIDTGG